MRQATTYVALWNESCRAGLVGSIVHAKVRDMTVLYLDMEWADPEARKLASLALVAETDEEFFPIPSFPIEDVGDAFFGAQPKEKRHTTLWDARALKHAALQTPR